MSHACLCLDYLFPDSPFLIIVQSPEGGLAIMLPDIFLRPYILPAS